MNKTKKWVCLFLALLMVMGMPSAVFAGERITPQWASGGAVGTHQFLTSQAISILLADKPAMASLLTLEYQNLLLTNSDWPDTYENDGGLYTSHFYETLHRKDVPRHHDRPDPVHDPCERREKILRQEQEAIHDRAGPGASLS